VLAEKSLNMFLHLISSHYFVFVGIGE